MTTVFFAGGGTGGHLYPGLAIARALVRAHPAYQPFFIGARRGIERDILPTTEFPHALLDLHPLYRPKVWNNWRTVRGAMSAWRALGALAGEHGPVGIVGTGGYAAAMALLYGRARGIPTFLHEPDSHPGKTTRLFAPGAREIYLGFPEAAAELRTDASVPVHAYGAPIEPPPLEHSSSDVAREQWGIPPDHYVVLVFGGSQGARAINDAVAAWCERGLPDGVSLIWATGRAQSERYEGYQSERVHVRPYLAPIADAYRVADLAVTRAGAMTIAELMAWGIPAMLVPLPTAAQDHQTHNARATALSGAALNLPQSELDAPRLDALVRELRADPARLEYMRRCALARARPGAAAATAESLARALAG